MSSIHKQHNVELALTTYMYGASELLRRGSLLPGQLKQLFFTKEALENLEQHIISRECWELFDWLVGFAVTSQTMLPNEAVDELAGIRNAIGRHLAVITVTETRSTAYSFARLWLSGRSMDPNEVTRLLELPPDWKKHPNEVSFVRHSSHSVSRQSDIFPGGHWWMNSNDWVDGGGNALLSEHIEWVLGQLDNKDDVFAGILEQDTSASLFCVCSTWDYESDLVPRALRERADELNIAIDLSSFEPAWG